MREIINRKSLKKRKKNKVNLSSKSRKKKLKISRKIWKSTMIKIQNKAKRRSCIKYNHFWK